MNRIIRLRGRVVFQSPKPPATTHHCGEVPQPARRLVQTTYEAMWKGIQAVRPGATLGDVGHAIERHARRNGYSIVREYCGHGIGREMHEEPQVLHWGKPRTSLGRREGMVFTIEPMENQGRPAVQTEDDGWTVVTRDGRHNAGKLGQRKRLTLERRQCRIVSRARSLGALLAVVAHESLEAIEAISGNRGQFLLAKHAHAAGISDREASVGIRLLVGKCPCARPQCLPNLRPDLRQRLVAKRAPDAASAACRAASLSAARRRKLFAALSLIEPISRSSRATCPSTLAFNAAS